MLDDLKQYKPFYVLAILIFLGAVIITAGITTDDKTGERAKKKKKHVAQGHSNAENISPESRKTYDKPGAADNKTNAKVNRTPHSAVPHRALYDITMTKKHGGARISNVSGHMAFEWRPACEGWLSRHRFRLAYEYPDSPGAHMVSRYSTLEAYDGSRMDFTSQRWRNGQIVEAYRGRAERGDGGERYKVTYDKPTDAAFEMPGNVMFPMAHTFAALRAAQKGKTFFRVPVFDGHDDKGEMLISAFIGDTINAMANIVPSRAIDTSLVNTKAWQVRMAFFPERDEEPAPDYELSAHLHNNSVISRMHVSYDEFTIEQKLVALAKLEVEPCE